MLTNREVGPLDERGVDLPAVRGEHLLDSLEGAEHHAMAHMDQTPPAYSLDHLRIAQPGQGHPTGLGHWALCLPAYWLYPVPLVHAGASFSLVYAVKGCPAYVHLNGLAIVRLK